MVRDGAGGEIGICKSFVLEGEEASVFDDEILKLILNSNMRLPYAVCVRGALCGETSTFT